MLFYIYFLAIMELTSGTLALFYATDPLTEDPVLDFLAKTGSRRVLLVLFGGIPFMIYCMIYVIYSFFREIYILLRKGV